MSAVGNMPRDNLLQMSEYTMQSFPILTPQDTQFSFIRKYTNRDNNLCFEIFDTLNKLYFHYTEKYIDSPNITAELINKRQKICTTFILNPIKIIKALTQREYIPESAYKVKIRDFEIYIKENKSSFFEYTPNIGFWIESLQTPSPSGQKVFGFDIISFYAHLNFKSYSASIEELYDYISTHLKTEPDTQRPKHFYVQENNPIYSDKDLLEDTFYCHFSYFHTRLVNNHGTYIGDFYGIKTCDNEFVPAYITLWRHHNSQIYFRIPTPPSIIAYPEKPGNLQKKDNILIINSCNEDNVEYLYNVLKSDLSRKDYTVALLHGGINNISDDAKNLTNKNIIFLFDDSFDYSQALEASKKLKKLHLPYEFLDIRSKIIMETFHSIDTVLRELKKDNTTVTLPKQNMIASPNDKIPGSTRKSISLLNPIIDTSSIIWLYAKEKAGKTILALTIAQAVGMGHRSIGPWNSCEPQDVLYIDGEMAGQRIDETIGKIIRAHDISGHEKRSFSVYSFIEEDIDFSTILDKEWQEKYIHQLKKFKLIIIDNFYSLISAHDPTNFIKWMRGLTKEGISFLVVDHTNSEGELQGSITKRRAMDLGIKLEVLSKDEILVEYVHDRYNKGNGENFIFIKNFTDSSMAFIEKPATSICTNETEKDILLAAIVICKKNKRKNNETAKTLGISESKISKDLKSLGYNCDLKSLQNINDKIKERRRSIEFILTKYDNDEERILQAYKSGSSR